MAHSYQVNQRVDATVEKVFSFGVFARLEDGTRAYIRPRNLDLDADVEPVEVVRVGQRITGVVVALRGEAGHIEISRRAALPDPWIAFGAQHRVGDLVVGEVRRLVPGGVFVRVAAGVQGFLPLAEMAPWDVEKPESLFWLGDQIEATIMSLSVPTQKMILSVRESLLKRERALELYDGLFPRAQAGDEQRRTGGNQLSEAISNPQALQLSGKLLILEDDPRLLRSLGVWFRRRGLEVVEAEGVEAAREKCAATRFDFLLLDVSLPDGDGLNLARELSGQNPGLHIFIMSTPENLIERLDELAECEVSQIFPKPLELEKIHHCFLRISSGEGLQVNELQVNELRANESQANKLARLENPAIPGSEPALALRIEESEENIQYRLERALAQVHRSVRAQSTILFRLDPEAQNYTIQAMIAGGEISPEKVYQLGDSPVKDVLRSGSAVVEGKAQSEARARYKKLLDLLPFESCLGLPLQVQGEHTHALFFFHPETDAFSQYRQRDARAGAYLITALLEEAAAEHRLQALSPLLISGQLASGFGHEVANHISNLELEILNQLTAQGNKASGASGLPDLLQRVQELKAITQSFQRLLWSGVQIVECDLDEVLKHAYQSVKPYSKRHKTSILLSVTSELPKIRVNPVVLQQVFVNMLLNAVQQIELKCEKHRWKGVRRVEVNACHPQGSGQLEIRIQDTGPGIHRSLWKKVFTAGYSTRGGSGMGLYISQMIIRQCGGTIEVEESRIPFGSTFLLRLPVHLYGDAV